MFILHRAVNRFVASGRKIATYFAYRRDRHGIKIANRIFLFQLLLFILREKTSILERELGYLDGE